MFASYDTDKQTQKAYYKARVNSIFRGNAAAPPFACAGHADARAHTAKSGAQIRPSRSAGAGGAGGGGGIHSDWEHLGAAAAAPHPRAAAGGGRGAASAGAPPPSAVPDLLSKIGRAPITETYSTGVLIACW